MNKRNLLLLTTVLTCAALLTAKQFFLSTHDADLFLDLKTVDAHELHAPAPGKAYAFHKRSEEWVQNELCQQQGVGLAPEQKVSFIGSNAAGLNYNEALEVVLGEGLQSVLRAKNVQVEWATFLLRHERSGAHFPENCVAEVEKMANDSRYAVFVVETVYLAEAVPQMPLMVRFKPVPVVFEICDTACDEEQIDLRTLLDASFVTRIKDAFVSIRTG
ncbi:hypothetical protein [Tropicibacter sp. Alg240-R139]|uniref:hypothetical protein n=1 Tax=Tropicibacter sp. Alg240-R139 TaxID=2305991 RepID=UPI0013E07590|nr:hypothetical protein [Tropicibacter sp. Alg240-R139]